MHREEAIMTHATPRTGFDPTDHGDPTMPCKIRAMPSLLALSLVLAMGPVCAGDKHDHHHHEHRQHDSHVHGIAELNLALDGREMQIELDSPAANLVGFEHAPSSAADRAALDQAVAVLEQGERLFVFNRAAGCRLADVEIESELIDGEHEGHKHHDEHDHDEKSHHGHQHDGETHADIKAAYRFECDNPARLEQLDVELFRRFAGTERLNVQFVIDDKQGAAELTASDPVLRF
jgi:hypothetical protein